MDNRHRLPPSSTPSQDFESLYSDLREIAARRMRLERPNHTIQVTALVHEAYIRLVREKSLWVDSSHLLALASHSMRHILVDHARGRLAKKRDSSEVSFHGFSSPEKFLALHEALERLAQIDSRQARIVELRFFVGMTEDEIAATLAISTRTVKREWVLARTWLFGELDK